VKGNLIQLTPYGKRATMKGMRGDEISVRDYIDVVVRRKKLIISIFTLSVGGALVAAFTLPKIYQAEAVLQLASVTDAGSQLVKFLYSKEEAKQIILSSEILKPVFMKYRDALNNSSLKIFRSCVRVETIRDEATPYVKLIVKSKNPGLAQSMCKAIVDEFFRSVNPRYVRMVDVFETTLTALGGQIANTEREIDAVSNTIAALSSDRGRIDPEKMSKIILLREIIASLKKQKLDLTSEEYLIRVKLVLIKEFRIVSTPDLPETPVFPRKLMMVGSTIIVALVFGTFVAFCVESIKDPRGGEE
jgi:uncharacterized protein involved in exopolysaccharide biosynthesis